MGFSRIVLIACLMSLISYKSCLAQNSPKEFVAAHNAARAIEGIPPVSWNNTVAAFAQQYANERSRDCNMVHSNGPYGENLAAGYPTMNAADAVKMWVDEKSFYDLKSNQCLGGECLHYTQVVWRDTTDIGCAAVKCSNDWSFLTCNYYPPGNYIGQRPF